MNDGTTPCPACGRKFGHLDNCQVRALHEQLDRAVIFHGPDKVFVVIGRVEEEWTMLLSYRELRTLQHDIIENSLPEHVNQTSIDITLGDHLLIEVEPVVGVLRLSKREPMSTLRVTLPCVLWPGQFVLAPSAQIFNLPDWLSAEYKLKSSMARMGLNHLNAGWCDAGWHGSCLTLELVNTTRYHKIELRAGDPIGQMVFFRHAPVPKERSYATRGHYNNDRQATGAKA